MIDNKLPRYFLINFETFVKVDRIGDEIVGTNQFGNQYPPVMALYDGQEIDESMYNDAVATAKKELQS